MECDDAAVCSRCDDAAVLLQLVHAGIMMWWLLLSSWCWLPWLLSHLCIVGFIIVVAFVTVPFAERCSLQELGQRRVHHQKLRPLQSQGGLPHRQLFQCMSLMWSDINEADDNRNGHRKSCNEVDEERPSSSHEVLTVRGVLGREQE